MPIGMMAVLPLLLAALTSHIFSQAPAPSTPAGPTFDVVSIKRNTTDIRDVPYAPPIDRPDGGFTWTRLPVMTFIARAYPPAAPIDMIGLPEWARTEQYDVRTTSTLARATPADRIAMLRTMLADRFKLAVHVEKLAQPVYHLVLARSDGKLGPGLTRLADVDCGAQLAAARAAAEAARNAGTPPPPRSPPQRPDFTAPPPPCTVRTLGAIVRDTFGDRLGRLGDLLEGETTMENLASTLRMATDRPVVNKTGLADSYRVKMNFEMRPALRAPDAGGPTPEAGTSVYTAVQEQLGLKLESASDVRDRLVIDRLERPTED